MQVRSLIAKTLLLALCGVPNAARALRIKPATNGGVSGAPIFKEAADQAGLSFRHYNGMTGKLFLPEIMGSGVALFDYDNDGDLDVFVVQGNVLEPGTKPVDTLFPWTESNPPRGRLFRNDLVIGK